MQIQCVCQEVHFTIFFPEVNSLKTYCAYFLCFLGKLKFPRASRHLISLPDKQVVKKVNIDPCGTVPVVNFFVISYHLRWPSNEI